MLSPSPADGPQFVARLGSLEQDVARIKALLETGQYQPGGADQAVQQVPPYNQLIQEVQAVQGKLSEQEGVLKSTQTTIEQTLAQTSQATQDNAQAVEQAKQEMDKIWTLNGNLQTYNFFIVMLHILFI